MKKAHAIVLAIVALSLMNSCGSDGNITQDLGVITGDFQILNLSTGTIESRAAVPDLLTNTEYRTTKMVFRSINGGSVNIGSPTLAFAAQADENQSAISVSRFSIAVFETTRDQWSNITNSTPWTVFSASLIGTSGNEVAASGLSRSHVTSVLAAYNAGKNQTLGLPSDNQWEYACRAGNQTTFSWGEDRSDTVVGTYAIVSETSSGIAGPRIIGARQANGFGLFDTHGNVWELTTTDDIRGGSWRDSLPMARSANKSTLDEATSHPLVGVRFILSL